MYQYLHGTGAGVPERSGPEDKTQPFVAYHHFDLTILQESKAGPMPVIDSNRAEALNLMDSHRLPRVAVGYHTAPIYHRESKDGPAGGGAI